ncbi:hypothetical protein W03_08840 [Nitrosomonas sp. PY1]|nr:hypothetical protein W03_08840 [Nitrosomonas sp. PY1]
MCVGLNSIKEIHILNSARKLGYFTNNTEYFDELTVHFVNTVTLSLALKFCRRVYANKTVRANNYSMNSI